MRYRAGWGLVWKIPGKEAETCCYCQEFMSNCGSPAHCGEWLADGYSVLMYPDAQ